jgi:hypothetical protein
VPDISDLAGKEGPCLSPIGAIVVQDLTGPGCATHTRIVAPYGVIAYPVRRVGDHQMRRDALEQVGDHLSICCIAAQHPVASEEPEVACSADRLIGRVGNIVLARVSFAVGHEVVDLAKREAQAGDVDAQLSEIAHLECEEVHFQPARSVSLLSAMISARLSRSERCESSITGTIARPSLRAAASLPCPAMMPFLPSTRIGFVKPKLRIEPGMRATCSSEWVLAFFA